MQNRGSGLLGGDDLRGSLGFQLKMLQVDSDGRARAALEPFDITPARVTALMVVQAQPGCTQTALGEALAVNRASAMKLVNFLEGRGLVERRAGPDMRTNAIFLTPEGRAQLGAMTEALRTADRDMLDLLSREEADFLLDCIRKMRAGASRTGSATRRAATARMLSSG